MSGRSLFRFTTIGVCLIAVSYGLARFAFGLFVPVIRSDLGLTAETIGMVGALAYVGYCASILATPALVVRLGPRVVAVCAGLFAAAGMAFMAAAGGVGALSAGLLLAGVSTGLISPAMTAAVAAGVNSVLQGRINAVINSGTSVGIVAAVPAALLLGGSWRQTYALFAGLALAGAVVALRWIPKSGRCSGTSPLSAIPAHRVRGAAILAFFAFAMGLASAVYWTFAPDMAVTVGGLSPAQAALIWLAVGLGGLSGAAAGDLVRRHGVAMTHGFFMASLTASMTLTAAVPESLFLALLAAAVFGAAYISLTAVYLLAGVRAFADNPALGLMIPFFMIALGQIAGAALAGYAVAALGHATTFGIHAAFGLLVGTLSPLMPEVEAPCPAPCR